MGLTPRPTKTGGTTEYLLEVGLGNIHIKATEVDDDFDTLYTLVNGNIDDANIAAGANIATSKIAQDAGLQTGHYADNSVTSAKIADGTIVEADLANDAVTTTKILDGAVTLAKMAPGSTVRFADAADDTAIVIAAEATVLTLGVFTPEGAASLITLHAHASGGIFVTAADLTLSIVMRLKRNGTTIQTATCNLLWPTAATPVNFTMPFAVSLSALEALQTVALTYTVTLEKVTAGAGTAIATAATINALVVEHA